LDVDLGGGLEMAQPARQGALDRWRGAQGVLEQRLAQRFPDRGQALGISDRAIVCLQEQIAVQRIAVAGAGDAGILDVEAEAVEGSGDDGKGVVPVRRVDEHVSTAARDRKSTRLNSSHVKNSYAVF